MPVNPQRITKSYVSFLGELDGIADQVVEDLAQPEIICNNGEIVRFIPLPQLEVNQLLSGSIASDPVKK